MPQAGRFRLVLISIFIAALALGASEYLARPQSHPQGRVPRHEPASSSTAASATRPDLLSIWPSKPARRHRSRRPSRLRQDHDAPPDRRPFDPASGRIQLGDRPLFRQCTKESILPRNSVRSALVFQDYQLFPHLTVEQNLRYGLDRNPKSTVEFAPPCVDILELRPHLAAGPTLLSGG
jgi:hypothetical protein